MSYKFSKELLDDMCNAAIIYHASGQLRFRLNEVLNKHFSDEILTFDPGCFERGCCAHNSIVDKDGISAVVLEIK
jgi:hypothetical protein